MAVVVEVTAASEGLLPGSCSGCTWWQSTPHGGEELGPGYSGEWMREVVQDWGSVGLVMVQGQDTLTSVRFAPVKKLARVHTLLPRLPDGEGVLLYCVRARVGRPSFEARRLVQRSLAHLRRRWVNQVYAYALPLDSESACGFKNLLGKEFLESMGFLPAAEYRGVFLMRVRLEGAVTVLGKTRERLALLRREATSPHPATFTGERS